MLGEGALVVHLDSQRKSYEKEKARGGRKEEEEVYQPGLRASHSAKRNNKQQSCPLSLFPRVLLSTRSHRFPMPYRLSMLARSI